MGRHLSLYVHFIAQQMKSRMSYRFDFLASNALMAVMMITQVLFVYLVFSQVKEIRGWSFWEVLLVYGFSSSAVAASQIISGPLLDLPRLIIRGEYDSLLIRPLSPFWHLLMRRIHDDWAVTLVARVMILFIAASKIPYLHLSLASILLLIAFLICGTIINISFNVLLTSLSFVFMDIRALFWLYLGDFYNLSYYPLTIYGRFLRLTLTWIFPLAFVSIVPADFFLRKTYFVSLAALIPAVTVLFVTLAVLAWTNASRLYESTGH